VLDREPKQDFSRENVRRMLGITEQQLRSWERRGLVAPRSIFSFTDLIALKALVKLRENGISPSKIDRAIASLKEKLADIREPLSELRILSDGRNIAVQVAGQKMEAITGQLLFDFDTAELGAVASFTPPPPAPSTSREKESEFWFQRGLALEESGAAVEEAIEAYRKSVELNPNAAGSLVNLGTIYFRMRSHMEAEAFYRRAVEADPKYPLALFNLGNLYDEEGDLEKARDFYTRALALNPGYADAHFNLALLCERTGEGLKAMHHWKAYLRADSSSSWAAIARRQLEKLKQAAVIRNQKS
jgi:tetratricopeptide (TPR) repeat protein